MRHMPAAQGPCHPQAAIGPLLERLAHRLEHHGDGMPPWLFDALGLIQVEGEVADPGTLAIGDLARPARPDADRNLYRRRHAGDRHLHRRAADRCAGGRGGVATDPAAHNDLLAHYVVATGSDGYRAVFSLGEIDPRFGGDAVMLAYDDTEGQLGWLEPDGRARMVVPDDAAGGRYVSDLAGLTIGTAPDVVAGAGRPLHRARPAWRRGTERGAGRGGSRRLAPVTLTTTYTAGGRPVTDTYTGVPLWDLLTEAGVTTDASAHNDILGFYVVATGSDGYRVVFSMGELDPRFGGESVLVAYDDTAGQLGPEGEDGFARMVVPGDLAGGRYVLNLVSIEVVDIDAAPGATEQLWA